MNLWDYSIRAKQREHTSNVWAWNSLGHINWARKSSGVEILYLTVIQLSDFPLRHLRSARSQFNGSQYRFLYPCRPRLLIVRRRIVKPVISSVVKAIEVRLWKGQITVAAKMKVKGSWERLWEKFFSPFIFALHYRVSLLLSSSFTRRGNVRINIIKGKPSRFGYFCSFKISSIKSVS